MATVRLCLRTIVWLAELTKIEKARYDEVDSSSFSKQLHNVAFLYVSRISSVNSVTVVIHIIRVFVFDKSHGDRPQRVSGTYFALAQKQHKCTVFLFV